jgi:hypothetical protein
MIKINLNVMMGDGIVLRKKTNLAGIGSYGSKRRN